MNSFSNIQPHCQQNYISVIILAVVYIGAVGLILDRGIGYIQQLIVPGEKK